MTILITGGNRGLGRATAEALLHRQQEVVITARDPKSGEQAVREMRQTIPGARVDWCPLDVASSRSIRELVQRLTTEDRSIDVLYHNAGILQSDERRITEDGFEENLAIHALGPLLLTRLLLPSLERSRDGRVIFVTSRLHEPRSMGVEVDFRFDDPHLERGYHPGRAYKNSKLAMLWVTFALAKKLPANVSATAICPGFVPTTAANGVAGFQRFMLRWVLPMMPFATKVATAAKNMADMVTEPRRSGTYWADGAEAKASDEALDPEKAARFWEMASQMLKLNT